MARNAENSRFDLEIKCILIPQENYSGRTKICLAFGKFPDLRYQF